MKEIFEAIESRVKSPIFGYFLIAVIAINWRPIFYLLFENIGTLERIKYFDDQTGLKLLIFLPAILAGAFSVIYPWVNLFFLALCTKPTDMKNVLQAQSEHKLLVKKNELEKLRSSILSSSERELIDRAKRDEELNEIQDEELKEKLRSEIEQLRQQRDLLKNSDSDSDSKLKEKIKELMETANLYRQRAKETNSSNDQSRLIHLASALEDKAQKIILDL